MLEEVHHRPAGQSQRLHRRQRSTNWQPSRSSAIQSFVSATSPPVGACVRRDCWSARLHGGECPHRRLQPQQFFTERACPLDSGFRSPLEQLLHLPTQLFRLLLERRAIDCFRLEAVPQFITALYNFTAASPRRAVPASGQFGKITHQVCPAEGAVTPAGPSHTPCSGRCRSSSSLSAQQLLHRTSIAAVQMKHQRLVRR